MTKSDSAHDAASPFLLQERTKRLKSNKQVNDLATFISLTTSAAADVQTCHESRRE